LPIGQQWYFSGKSENGAKGILFFLLLSCLLLRKLSYTLVNKKIFKSSPNTTSSIQFCFITIFQIKDDQKNYAVQFLSFEVNQMDLDIIFCVYDDAKGYTDPTVE
jgi:hypothetical protein